MTHQNLCADESFGALNVPSLLCCQNKQPPQRSHEAKTPRPSPSESASGNLCCFWVLSCSFQQILQRACLRLWADTHHGSHWWHNIDTAGIPWCHHRAREKTAACGWQDRTQSQLLRCSTPPGWWVSTHTHTHEQGLILCPKPLLLPQKAIHILQRRLALGCRFKHTGKQKSLLLAGHAIWKVSYSAMTSALWLIKADVQKHEHV